MTDITSMRYIFGVCNDCSACRLNTEKYYDLVYGKQELVETCNACRNLRNIKKSWAESSRNGMYYSAWLDFYSEPLATYMKVLHGWDNLDKHVNGRRNDSLVGMVTTW